MPFSSFPGNQWWGYTSHVNDNSTSFPNENGDDINEESAITIHAEGLSDTTHFSYNGEEEIRDEDGNIIGGNTQW